MPTGGWSIPLPFYHILVLFVLAAASAPSPVIMPMHPIQPMGGRDERALAKVSTSRFIVRFGIYAATGSNAEQFRCATHALCSHGGGCIPTPSISSPGIVSIRRTGRLNRKAPEHEHTIRFR